MPNKLEKVPQQVNDTGSGGSGGGGSGGGGGGLPPQGSRCLAAIGERIRQLWPFYLVEYVAGNGGGAYFRVSSQGGQYVWHVTGSCSGGYISLDYELVNSPAVASD